MPLAPRLLNRLRSLSALHASAAEFDSTLRALKSEVGRLTEGEQGLQDIVSRIDESLQQNETKLKGNLDTLEDRIQALGHRMDKLGV